MADRITCGCGRSLTAAGMIRHKCDLKPIIYRCEFCKRQFTTEARLLAHVCEQKRRFLQRDERHVRLGFMAYEEFYRHAMHQAVSYDNFMASTLYGGFVRFGRHLLNLGAINVVGFINFLLRIEAPIDEWTNLRLYRTYIRELSKTETALDAIERNFRLMQQWSETSGEQWHDFFRKVEPPLATLWISNGRLSPWMLFTASSANELLTRLNQEQTGMVEQSVDTEFWQLKIERHQQEVEEIRSMLAQHGI